MSEPLHCCIDLTVCCLPPEGPWVKPGGCDCPCAVCRKVRRAAESMSKPADDATMSAVMAWDAIARMHGYNEMAKQSKTLGEETYCRLARDAACEEAISLGADIRRTEVGGDVLMTVDEIIPSITFRASDIEKMREAVRAFDLANGETKP